MMLPLAMLTVALAAAEQLPDRTTFLIEFQVKRPGLTQVFGGNSDPERAGQYTYTEKVTELTLDSKGNTKSSRTDIFHAIPTRLPGYTYRRQVVKDGVALSPAELDRQDHKHEEALAKAEADRRKWNEEFVKRRAEARRKFQQTVVKDLDRKKITGEERRKREEEAMRAYDDALAGRQPADTPPPKMEDSAILQALDFQLVRREIIDGHPAILLSFEPKPNYKPQDDITRFLYRTEGRVWVSEDDYRIIKLEARLVDALSFGLGLLAKVQPGSMGVFEWRKVNDEVWMPSREDFTANVRILLVKGQHIREIHEYYEHRKFVVDTEIRALPDEVGP